MRELAKHNHRMSIGIALVAVFLLVIGLGYTPGQQHATGVGAATDDFIIVNGFAWNQKTGWIKQRGIVGDAFNKQGNYGVKINSRTGSVEGWSWSSIYGWICWGLTCRTNPGLLVDQGQYGSPTPPQIPGYTLTADATIPIPLATNNKLTGWAKIVKLGDAGWIKLASNNGATYPYSTTFDDNTKQFDGWAWNCVDDSHGGCDQATSIGWIVFSGHTLSLADPSIACRGENEDGTPGEGTARCYTYSFDSTTANNDSKWYTEIIAPWLETQGGNIYAQKDPITGEGFKPPFSGLKPPVLNLGYNASYLIHSNGAISTKWQSACRASASNGSCGPNNDINSQTPNSKVSAFNSPKVSNGYRNQLGFINISALTDLVIVDSNTKKNAYGYKVDDFTTENDLANILSAPLDNGVWVHEGSFTLGSVSTSPLTVFNATSVPPPAVSKTGAGTIVIKGDLTIKRPILYSNTALSGTGSSVRQTPSIAWIVLGNIKIDSCIPPSSVFGPAGPALLSGAFIAEGTISTGHGGSINGDKGSALSSACPAGTVDGNGVPALGSFGNNDVPLQVNGIMMAQEYNFERVYTGNDTGSESIRDDGRLIANTPPGLEDIAKTLPLWRSNRLSP